ncbi:hypothetical protein TWF730_010121 [Orbilia blumenaviensis]|uniref:Uncharacterized protein n=1 Tax=Orbilia blumenaviensis TaxID=1796055 RepID=A0AAV9UUR7_9PEZI
MRTLPENSKIFFVAHCANNRTMMKEILMQGFDKDSDLFLEIRKKYHLIRGWRRFFSWTTIRDIEWIRFKRYNLDMSQLLSTADGPCDNIRESLPHFNDINYEIEYREPPTRSPALSAVNI